MGDRDIRLTWSTSPAGLFAGIPQPPSTALGKSPQVLPHTDQLRRMVAIADRSPARYILELKLAEVPSGPLSSKLMMLASATRSRSSAIVRTAVRFPTTNAVAF